MSKKFGMNSKSVEAKARKDAVKQAVTQEKQQKLEDEYWQDDDKHVQKKQQRKDDKEKKELEKLQRKQDAQKLLEQEEAAISAAKKSNKNVDLPPQKVTQAQIQQRQTAAAAAAANPANEKTVKKRNVQEEELEENVNRLQIDGASARNVDEALHVLNSSAAVSVDSHPEKRMRAAYQTYEEEQLAKMKIEHPTLRLSQLKQLIKKEWMKAPENPFNKPIKAYNESTVPKQNPLPEESKSDEDDS